MATTPSWTWRASTTDSSSESSCDQIEARAHFLIILTPGTVERCAEPGDWLRREIEYAIDKQRNIVPLLLNGFTFKDTESVSYREAERIIALQRLADVPMLISMKQWSDYGSAI